MKLVTNRRFQEIGNFFKRADLICSAKNAGMAFTASDTCLKITFLCPLLSCPCCVVVQILLRKCYIFFFILLYGMYQIGKHCIVVNSRYFQRSLQVIISAHLWELSGQCWKSERISGVSTWLALQAFAAIFHLKIPQLLICWISRNLRIDIPPFN